MTDVVDVEVDAGPGGFAVMMPAAEKPAAWCLRDNQLEILGNNHTPIGVGPLRTAALREGLAELSRVAVFTVDEHGQVVEYEVSCALPADMEG